MTTPKGAFRQRRTNGTTAIPRNIREWFAGERRFTFYAHTWPYQGELETYWRAWQKEHPDAVMPEALPGLIESAAAHKRMISDGA